MIKQLFSHPLSGTLHVLLCHGWAIFEYTFPQATVHA